MTIDEFRIEYEEAKRERPKVFSNLMFFDPPASSKQLEALESEIECKLPSSYCEYVSNYGSGEYIFGLLYSAEAESDWYLAKKVDTVSVNLGNFLPISENGVGDIYGFKIYNGECDSRIYLWDHETGEIEDTKLNDVFEFMVKHALRPA